MGASLQAWIVAIVDGAAAIVFFYIGRRLSVTGLIFASGLMVMAIALIMGGSLLGSRASTGLGYSMGLASAIWGSFQIRKTASARKKRNRSRSH